jgi:hypothetical protein
MASSSPSQAFLRQQRLAEAALVEATEEWRAQIDALVPHATPELRAYHRGLIDGFKLGDPGWRALTERRKRRSAAAAAAWQEMMDEADQMVADGAVPALRDPPREPVVVATPEAVLRSAAIARGEISALPTDPTARAILRAGQRRRNEPEDPA